MNEGMKEGRNELTNKGTNRTNALGRPHLPKVLRRHCFFITFWNGNRALAVLSLQSLVHIWLTWSSKNAPIPSFFCDFGVQSNFIEMQIELSLQSRAHFANFIFPKCSDPLSCLTVRFWNANRAPATVWCTFCRSHLPKVLQRRQFFNILKCKSSSRYNPVHFLPTIFPDRAMLPERAQGCRHDSVFTREFTRSRAVTLPNYLMMVGWHDDVVDMMLGMLTMTIVRNSEVSN